MKPTHMLDAEPPESAPRLAGRFFFGTTAGAALVSAAILSVAPLGLAPSMRAWLVGSVGLFAVLCGLAVRISARERFPMPAALCGVAVTAMGLSGLVSALLNEGLRSPPLGFCGLIVCVVGALTGVRCSVALGAFALAGMTAIAWAETRGWITAPAAPTRLGMVLLYQSLIVLCGRRCRRGVRRRGSGCG